MKGENVMFDDILGNKIKEIRPKRELSKKEIEYIMNRKKKLEGKKKNNNRMKSNDQEEPTKENDQNDGQYEKNDEGPEEIQEEVSEEEECGGCDQCSCENEPQE